MLSFITVTVVTTELPTSSVARMNSGFVPSTRSYWMRNSPSAAKGAKSPLMVRVMSRKLSLSSFQRSMPVTSTVSSDVTKPSSGVHSSISGGVVSNHTCTLWLYSLPAWSITVTTMMLSPSEPMMVVVKWAFATGTSWSLTVTMEPASIQPETTIPSTPNTSPSIGLASCSQGTVVSTRTLTIALAMLPAASSEVTIMAFGPSLRMTEWLKMPSWFAAIIPFT